MKLFSPSSDVLLGPRAQFDLLEQLESSAIAPRPVTCDESTGLLVTEFIDDATSVDVNEFSRPERLREVASLLKVLHQVQSDIPVFAPERHAQLYIDRIGGYAQLSSREKKRSDELIELADSMDSGMACLCHNDLIAENILFGTSSKLIDFDYAVVGPPLIDLASVVVINALPRAAETELLDAYFRDCNFPFSAAEFARVQRLVRLLAHFWSLASKNAEAAIVARYRMEDD